ncbi:hypothetical protein SVIOM74S_08986 [Streptomyces violarus]
MVQSPLRPDPQEVGDTAFVTPAELAERHGEGHVLLVVPYRAGRGPAGGPGAERVPRPAGQPGARRALQDPRGLERQGGPDHLAAARRVFDVAHPARLQGDLPYQEQSPASPSGRGRPPGRWGGRGGCPPRTPAPTRRPRPPPPRAPATAAPRAGRRWSPAWRRSAGAPGAGRPRPVLPGGTAGPARRRPRLRDGDLHGGGGEPPHPFVRQWSRNVVLKGLVLEGFERWACVAFWAWAGPAPVVVHRPVATLALDCHHTSSVGNEALPSG